MGQADSDGLVLCAVRPRAIVTGLWGDLCLDLDYR